MTTENSFNCVLCNNKQFQTKEDLQNHFRIHGDPNFSSKKNKLISQESPEDVDNGSLITCDVCPKVFPDPATVLSHKRKIHPETYEKIFCSWCGKFFTMKLLFDRHLLEHDTDEKPEQTFHCDLCSIDFYNIPAMTYHNKFYHQQKNEVAEIGYSKKRRRINETLVKILFCPHCGEESINKVNLHKHINDNHEEDMSVDSTLRCPLCEAVFYSLDAYEMHLTFHSTSDVYISKKKSFWSKLSEFTLETLPPKIERIDNEEDLNLENNEILQGLFLPMEEDQFNEPVLKHIPKKHKKHKISKKSAITLDEFLNMNTDVFGEGLDFQGIEEVPTQVVAKQLKRKKPNVNTSLNIQKLKALGINVKKKPSMNKPNTIQKIQVSNTLGRIKKITDSDSKLQNNSPTACNSMLTKLLNQSKDLKVIKKSGENAKLKEVMECDNNKDNNDEKSDPDMKVSVAVTHLSPNENDIVIKKETIDETECDDSITIMKTKVFQSENNDQVCKQEVFNDYENDDMNYDIDDATDLIKDEMDIGEEIFNIPAAPVIKKERDGDDANGSNEENKLEQNYTLKTNILLNSDITIKPPKKSPSTCSTTNTNNESDNKNKIASNCNTDVKIEPINDFNNEDTSNLESPVTPSPPEVNQTQLQNVDTKTKLLLNSQITLKPNNTNKVMNIVKQNILEPKKNNKNEIPMHKLHNHLLSNSQITIKSPKSKELIKLSHENEINKPEAESCEETVGYADKCDNFDASTSGTSKLKLLKDLKDKKKNTDEIPTLAMNPKNMLLLNSQITVKSSNSNTKHGDGKEIESFDENFSDIDADSDSSTSKLHLSKKTNIKETAIDRNKNTNQIETSSMSPKNKLLLNSQITLKSSNNNTMDGKEKDIFNNESDKDGDSDSDASDSDAHSLKKYQESALEKNKHIYQIETSSMSPKNKLLLNSQITLKSTNNETMDGKEKDSDNESYKDGDSDSDSSQIHSLNKYQESALEKNKHINQIKTTLSPKAKLLHNCNITVKSSPNSNLKMSSDNKEISQFQSNYKREIGGEIVKTQKKQSSDSDSDDYDTIRNLNMIPNKNKIMFKQSNSLKTPVENEELYSEDDEFDGLDDVIYKKQNIQQQSGYTMNKVKTLKEETCFNNTNKILNNTQLTIKQIHTKSTANKVMSSNNREQKITMTSSVKKNESLAFSNQTNQTDNSHMSVQKIVKINESSRNTLNNTLQNFTGIKIKQHKQSTSSDDEVEYVGGLSDDELLSSLKPHKTITQHPNKVNALSNVKNKLGVGITVKNLNLKSLEDEDNLETDSGDEIKEPVQIGSIINQKNSIVNKLKTNNLGLSIKPLKQNSNDSISDKDQTEASTSPRDDPRPTKITLEKNTNSNKHLMVKPYKPIENCNRDIKNKSLGQIKNANQNLIDNGGDVVKQETTSTSNEGETVTQAVTVKQFKTETVIEEITTTVTKTIRTVSQAVNEEHATTSTQKSLNPISQPSPTFAARPVKITNQVQRFVAPTNVGRIRQATPRAPRALRPMQSVMPVRCSAQPRPIVFRSPNPRGPRPVKIANNPNRMTRPSISPQCMYKTVKIASNVKTASVQKPVQRVSPAADKTVHQVSTAQSFKASQKMTKNVSGTNTTKVVQRSMVASSQMKSEFNSAGTSQVSKVSMSSVNAKTVQKFESNVSKSNSTSLIEKLQQQGLLIKKPRIEVDFSDHSDDEETIDYDND